MSDRRPWTPEEDAVIRTGLAEGLSHAKIAERLGFDRTITAVGIRASRQGMAGNGASKPFWAEDEQRDALLLDWADFRAAYPGRTHGAYTQMRVRFRAELSVPSIPLIDYTRLVQKVEGDAVVAACVHAPQTDPTVWAKVLAVGEHHAIPNLIIAGDPVTGDMFSKWTTREAYTFEQELESLRLHLRAALRVFKQVVVEPGNHIGNRIVVVTNGHIRVRQMIDMCGLADEERERVLTTDLDVLDLYSGDQKFKVGHASSYSVIDGKIPVEYASVEECHVITGHGHRMGMQVSKSGKWYGFEIGTCADPRYMGYAQRGFSKMPRMVQGFATVRNGAVRLYGVGRPLTDWTQELAS